MPIRRFLKKYWFRPAKWGQVAIYYPTMFPGWIITLSCLFFLLVFSLQALSFLDFLIKALIVMLVYDLFCFRTGEWPHWWKK